MDRQRLTERLLENESLTSDLTDAAAKTVLNWAVARLDSLNPPDDEHFTALAQFLRGINRLAGSLPDVAGQDLAALLTLHQAAFGASRAADESECTRLAHELSEMTLEQVVDTVLEWAAAPASQRRAHHAGGAHVA